MTSPSDARAQALAEAYRLIESVQSPDAPLDEVERLEAFAVAREWPDVRALTQWARVLQARHRRADAAPALQAMLACAERSGDAALVALALSTSALSTAVGDPATAPPGLDDALTRAVVLLDEVSEFAAHRAAAHIEVALCFHTHGLWELARQHYDLAEAAWPAEVTPAWQAVMRCQRRAIVVNRLDILIDWSCALAELDDWQAAAGRAAEALPLAVSVADAEFPRGWARCTAIAACWPHWPAARTTPSWTAPPAAPGRPAACAAPPR